MGMAAILHGPNFQMLGVKSIRISLYFLEIAADFIISWHSDYDTDYIECL